MHISAEFCQRQMKKISYRTYGVFGNQERYRANHKSEEHHYTAERMDIVEW